MSTYSDLMLSLAPVRYARCDELSTGVLTDSSTFAQHGTTDALAIFGQPSAIETDSASSSIGSAVGSLPAPTSSEADVRGNITMLGWIYYDTAFGHSGHLLNRRGQWGLSNNVQIGIDEDFITADITLENGGSGDFFRLVGNATLVDKTWYFIAAVRNSTTWLLYVNADLGLGNQRADLTTADIDYNVNGRDWFIGRSHNTTAFSAARSDEVAVFDYALTQGQVTALYEAALNQLLLHGRSDVIVTSTLSSIIEAPPTSFPFRHNWTEPLVERLAFRTGLSSARTGVEEGNEQRVAPRRELEFTQVLRTNTERRKFRALLWANQHAKWFVPVRQDAGQLTTPLTVGTTTIPVDTAYKDYALGSYIGLRQLDARGNITHWEEQVITAVNLTSVECTSITYDYTARLSWAYPVRRALLPPSVTVRGHTDAVEESTITFRLLPEDESASPARIIPWTPAIKYRDYEVFDPSLWPTNDWTDPREYDVSRETSEVDFGGGLLGVESDTTGATESIPWRIKTKGRPTIARFLGWFYERRGRARYLWVPTEQSDFDVLAVDGAELTVADTNYSDAFVLAEARRDLAFIYHDGSMVFRRVVGFSGTVDETLTLDATVPSLTNLRCVSLLKFCRLDGDQIEIAWHTDDTVEIAWAFRELLHTPEGAGVSSLSPSASVSVSLSPSGSASPSSSVSPSRSPSGSTSPSASVSPSHSASSSPSLSPSPSHSSSPSS
jgi:hypothetical protein